MPDYNKISKLIELYGEFESQNPNSDLTEFGRWLSCTQDEKKNSSALFLQNKKKTNTPAPIEIEIQQHLQSMHRDKPLEVQIAILLGRMNKFSRLYVKKAYGEGFSITIDEFQFLATAAFMEETKKSDLITLNVSELTTGTEIINRLIRQNLLKQSDSKIDKRTKIVEITGKGKKILFDAFERMHQVSGLVMGNLNEEQQKRLLEILEYLNQFHVSIYLNSRDESIETMKELYLQKKTGQ